MSASAANEVGKHSTVGTEAVYSLWTWAEIDKGPADSLKSASGVGSRIASARAARSPKSAISASS